MIYFFQCKSARCSSSFTPTGVSTEGPPGPSAVPPLIWHFWPPHPPPTKKPHDKDKATRTTPLLNHPSKSFPVWCHPSIETECQKVVIKNSFWWIGYFAFPTFDWSAWKLKEINSTLKMACADMFFPKTPFIKLNVMHPLCWFVLKCIGSNINPINFGGCY